MKSSITCDVRPVPGNRLSLEEMQKMGTNILFDVHDFCVEHDIRYSLAYGSLIGAIRHKGFIPWDDDVDLIMPRKDFERFCSEYESENGYKVLNPSSPESLITFGRVYDTRLTRCETTGPWCTFMTGIWVDIFPLDGVEDDNKEFLRRVSSLKKNARRLAMKRYSLNDFRSTEGFIGKCKWIVKRLLTYGYSFGWLKSECLKVIREKDYDASNYFGQLSCYDDGTCKEHNPQSDFTYCVEVEFEGRMLHAMNGYDNILRRYYGDYMQLPPIDQRRIENHIRFFWL